MKKVVPLQNLITQFARLPGIGNKTAQRLAFHVLTMTEKEAKDFSEAILEAHSKIRRCEEAIAETEQALDDANAQLSAPQTASDYEQILRRTQTINDLHERQDELMAQWELLSEQREALEA